MDDSEEGPSQTDLSPTGLQEAQRSMPREVDCEGDKGGSPLSLPREESLNQGYGTSEGVGAKRWRRRKKQNGAHKKVYGMKSSEEDDDAQKVHEIKKETECKVGGGNSCVPVPQNEAPNWEYGTCREIEGKRRRFRKKRDRVHKIGGRNWSEEDAGVICTEQKEDDQDVDYIVQEDWTLKAVLKGVKEDESKLEPRIVDTVQEQEDDMISLREEESDSWKHHNVTDVERDDRQVINMIDHLERLDVSEEGDISKGVVSCEEVARSTVDVARKELAERFSDEVAENLRGSVPHPASEAKKGRQPFVLSETALNELKIEFNAPKYLQNGTLEVLFEKRDKKDYVHVVVYECNGGEKPERISRHSFRICASSVISADSSEEDLRGALLDAAKRLEKVSADSLISIEKQPYEVSECSLPYLARRCIVPLKNKSTRFARSIYYCNLCHFHVSSVGHAITHFETKEHREAEQRKATLRRLNAIPSPKSLHLQCVAELLRMRLEEKRLSSDAYVDCELLIHSINELLARLIHRDCCVQLYGSYLVRNASPQSDVNLSLSYPDSFTTGQIVNRVTEALENVCFDDWIVCEVTTDLQRSSPTICFCLLSEEERNTLKIRNVSISVQSTRYFNTSQLIALYGRIRPQFIHLSLIFRDWAQICSLDTIALGGLPKVAFDLMLIHFLQIKGLLPFLFEIKDSDCGSESKSSNIGSKYEDDEQRIIARIGVDDEEWDMARLWTELFRYYVLEHPTEKLVQIRFSSNFEGDSTTIDSAHWNRKRLAIEDPCAPERVMQPSQYFVDFFSNCFLTTFLYFWIPRTASGPLISYKLRLAEMALPSRKKPKTSNGIAKGSANNMKHEEGPNEMEKPISGEGDEQMCGLFGDDDRPELTVTEETNQEELEGLKIDSYEGAVRNEGVDFEYASRQLWLRMEQADEDEPSFEKDVTVDQPFDIGKAVDQHFDVEKVAISDVGNVAVDQPFDMENVADSSAEDAVWDAFDGFGEKLIAPKGYQTDSINVEWQFGEASNAFDVDSTDIAKCRYKRSLMLELSRKAIHHFVPQKELEQLGIYYGCRSVDIETGAVNVFVDGLNDVDGAPGNRPTKGHIDSKGTEKAIKLSQESPTLKQSEASIELKLEIPEMDTKVMEEKWANVRKEDLLFEWNITTLANDMKAPLRCACCGMSGHLMDACPELQLPPIIPLRPLSIRQRDFLEMILRTIYERRRMTIEYAYMMRDLCRNLEKRLRAEYRTDCRLTLFGSAGNGFGLIGSDADICLRFGPDSFPEETDASEVIMNVAGVVRKMPGILSVMPVPNAKVPIVKIQCHNRYNRLEADVSLYNVLALENTRLLHAYSELDERARVLGIVVKEWAKWCEIGDASRGSLSSYSFIVMLIHFLQRTIPPVLPFLQQIEGRNYRKESRIVDGCDAYFCRAEDSGWRTENMEIASELWIGFLDYFSRQFDFTREVVQIRRQEPLSKLDKGWQGRPIAIEDPFDLKHNLSAGVHLKTMAYIQRSFIQSRERFARIRAPIRKFSGYKFEAFMIDLFSSCRVGDGPPLARNCCYRCKQIGHFIESCPLGQKGNRKNNANSVAPSAFEKRHVRGGGNVNSGTEVREREQHRESVAGAVTPSRTNHQTSNRGNGSRRRGRPRQLGPFPEPCCDAVSPQSSFPNMRGRGHGRGGFAWRINSENVPNMRCANNNFETSSVIMKDKKKTNDKTD